MDPGADVEAAFAGVIADALRKDFGDAPTHVKHIARLTGRTGARCRTGFRPGTARADRGSSC